MPYRQCCGCRQPLSRWELFPPCFHQRCSALRCPPWPSAWGAGLGNTMDSNSVSYGPCGRRSAERLAVRRFGATQLWLYGLILFAIFSAVCALSPRFEVLLAARMMQGLAGGLLVPAGQTILAWSSDANAWGGSLARLASPSSLPPYWGHRLAHSCLKAADGEGYFGSPCPSACVHISPGGSCFPVRQ